MNYKGIYDKIIYRARNRILESYTERHHIVPRCMGGSDEEDNMVDLTPEEHYLAHQLLVKMYPNDHRLAIAAAMMIPNRLSNKMYGWLKRRFSKAMSDSQTGKGNSQYGTRWIHNIELEESKKISSTAELPCNWAEGRILDFASHKAKLKIKEELRLLKQQAKKDEAERWYSDYLNSKSSSLREFVRNSDYNKSHVSFIKMLKKYVPEFNPEHGKAFKK